MTCSQKFAELAQRSEKALVLFVTAGDPPLEQLPAILRALQQGGADVVEVGLPFSDPIADGPTIQASSQRALDRGVTTANALSAIKEAELDIPVVAMGYYNSVLRHGLPGFAAQLMASGVSGTIISDLTPEEADPWIEASQSEGLENIFLAAPTSTDERLREASRRTSGFVYAVSRTGVTGAATEAPPEVQELVKRIKSVTSLPVCVGFGISKPEHVRMVCEAADGAVIGSALVTWLEKNWNGGAGASDLVRLVRSWKAAAGDGR